MIKVGIGVVIGLIFGLVTGTVTGLRTTALILLTYIKDERMTPIKEKEKIVRFDFIDSLFFKFIWIILPLVFWLGSSQPFELFKVMLFICVTFVYFGYLISRITHPIFLFKSKVFVLLLLLFFIQVISSILGDRLNISVFGLQYRYQGLITQVSYILFVMVAVMSKDLYLKYIKWGSISVAFLILIEKFFYRYQQSVGTMGNPNFTGGYLAISIAFIDNPLIILIITLAILFTGSRSSLLAAMIIILGKVYFKYKNFKLILISVLLIVIFGVWVYPQRDISHFDNRGNIWQKGIDGAINKPIIGWGVENFELAFNSALKFSDFDLKNIRVDKAHNELLEMFVSSGTIGLFLYICIVLLTLRYLWGNTKMFLCFVGYLIICNLNVLSLNEYLFYYLCVGTAIKNK